MNDLKMRELMPLNNKKVTSDEIADDLPEVTVIVVTYNQDFGRIVKTLDSIVMQEGISFEIIICDDGSEIRFEKELRSYFSAKGFQDYTLIFHDHNEGTVSNYYSGLCKARGKYTKLISPGDFLIEKEILYQWVQYLKKNKAEWSFSDTYYYRSDHGNENYFRSQAHPQIIRPYLKKDESKCIWNYIALRDLANGAAIIGTKRTQAVFCKKIIEYGVRYCEDNIYRLMTFHGIVGCYYPEVTISYEYGLGVSTSGNGRWKKLMREDNQNLIQCLLREKGITDLQRKMLDAMGRQYQPRKIRKLFIKGKLFHWMKYHYFPRLTPLPEDACKQNGKI